MGPQRACAERVNVSMFHGMGAFFIWKPRVSMISGFKDSRTRGAEGSHCKRCCKLPSHLVQVKVGAVIRCT